MVIGAGGMIECAYPLLLNNLPKTSVCLIGGNLQPGKNHKSSSVSTVIPFCFRSAAVMPIPDIISPEKVPS